MASRTAEGFYESLVNGLKYLSDYFEYIGKENLLREIKHSWHTLARGILLIWRITEKILQFSKRVTTEAFHFIVPVVTAGNTMSQNARRTRDEVSSTYMYPAVGLDENESSSEAMWAMFQQIHGHCFTTDDLRKGKRT